MPTATSGFDDTLTVERDGVSLHVAVAGMPRAAPVLLLHGLGGWHGEWSATASALKDSHRVIAFDQRGHGMSTVAPIDLSREAHVADVITVLDALDIRTVTLVGQSAGGHTAMLTAAASPERVTQLVLAEAGVGGDAQSDQDTTIDWFRSWPAPFTDLATFTEFFGGSTQVAQAWWAGLATASDGRRPRWIPETMRGVLAGISAREYWGEWESISCPINLIRASRSAIPEPQIERMTAHPTLEGPRVVEAGHDLHLENPEGWLASLRASIDTR